MWSTLFTGRKRRIGTKKDLDLYRLQTARSDLKSARILLEAGIASREESQRQVAVAEEFLQMAEQYCMAHI